MNKKELTKAIRKSAREQIKIYEEEVREWSDWEMKLRFNGGIQGIKEFLINLKKIGIIS